MQKSLTETVVEIISSRELPTDPSFLEGFLSIDRKRFDAEECTYWDYKREFPFSLKDTDEYFCGIVRLIAALHNTYGGLIIFGVHDKLRTYGHNKVIIDVERFNSRLREAFGVSIDCSYRRYQLQDKGFTEQQEAVPGAFCVDIILVPKRPAGRLAKPVVALESVSGQIWIRRGAEVVRADSADFSWLYGPRSDFGLEQVIPSQRIFASLPPSPATIRKFVGRSDVLDRLFHWLLVDDNEPRVFLFGSGGSGKSTIAYEFARLVELHGQALTPLDGCPISKVLYFSAKERYLDPLTGKIAPSSATDFSTKRELFEWIIRLGEGVDDNLSSLTESALETRIKRLFDDQRLLVVIDDIDTLLTKGEAAGVDSLYKSAIRGRAGTKLLYTQRSLPSLSQENAIEVPGLRHDGSRTSEYYSFIEACCRQFGITMPSNEFIEGSLSLASGRRPLVVETILALKRTSGTYDDALRLFKHEAGDDARSYLFGREYDRLNPDNKARYLLAALSLMPTAASLEDLVVALKFEESQVRDALTQVSDMFLSPAQDQDITTFSLIEIAREFVDKKSRSLDKFVTLHERVSNLLRTRHSEPAELKRIRLRVKDATDRNDYRSAWNIVDDRDISEKIKQNPHFLALRGEVAALMSPPRLIEAREAFKDCVSFKYFAPSYLRTWYTMEMRSGYGMDQAIDICKIAISKGQFDILTRSEFRSRLGSVHYRRARELEATNPTDAAQEFEVAATNHLRAYSDLFYTNADITRNEEYVRNTLFSLFNFHRREHTPYGLLAFMIDIPKRYEISDRPADIIVDATTEPVLECLRRLPDLADSKGAVGRSIGYLNRLENLLGQSSGLVFHDPDRKSEVLIHLANCRERLEGRT